MTDISDLILVFYVLGIILFIIGFETRRIPHTFIYLGISFLINIMGYYKSYSDSDFVNMAYFPLVLTILSVVIIIYYGFESLKLKTDDKYKEETE